MPIKAQMKDYDNKTGKAMKEYATRTAPKDTPAKTTTATPSTKPAATGSVKNAPTRSNPKTYGEGNEKVRGGHGGDKANVSAAQLKASGLTLRQYMNKWNKTGSRPTGKK